MSFYPVLFRGSLIIERLTLCQLLGIVQERRQILCYKNVNYDLKPVTSQSKINFFSDLLLKWNCIRIEDGRPMI